MSNQDNSEDSQMSYQDPKPSRITTYVYDAAGRLIAESHPDAAVVRYEYTEADLAEPIKSEATSVEIYTYDSKGNRV